MNRLKAVVLFVFAWLNTPSSKAGIVAILTGALGAKVAPEKIEGVVQIIMLAGGVGLVLWPQKPEPKP